MRVADLKEKEVINNCDCKRLGYVDDVVFDICTGKLEALVITGPSKLCGLITCDFEYVLPFACIVQMGEDIILVKVKEDDVKHKIV